MKLEVIGWTYYDNPRYPTHVGDEGAVTRAVVRAIREGGYRFGGNYHQDGFAGAPVLNDGTMALYSARGWGGIMAIALELDNSNGYAYTVWYMDNLYDSGRDNRIAPPGGVDKDRIVKRKELAEHFSMHLCPEAFKQIKRRKKTYELRLWDERRQPICRGDYIEFTEDETGETLKVKVTAVTIFDDFERVIDDLPLEKIRCNDGETAEELLARLHTFYPEELRKKYHAVAYRIRRLRKDELV